MTLISYFDCLTFDWGVIREFRALVNHIGGIQFGHKDIERRHLWVLLGEALWVLFHLLLIILFELGHGAAVHIVPEVSEHGGADSPGWLARSLGDQVVLLCLLSVYHFMETREDITTCDVLESFSGLKKEAAVRDFHLELLVVSQPDVEAWVARFAVDCQESDVVMEPCEDCTYVIFL